jgi:hypothetical protein
LSEDPAYPQAATDNASDFTGDSQGPQTPNQRRIHPASSLFHEPDDEAQRELEKPTFLRRLGF